MIQLDGWGKLMSLNKYKAGMFSSASAFRPLAQHTLGFPRKSLPE